MDRILAELAQADYLVAHGFKNQYGSGENLHRLVDLRLIYGNFGMGSQVVSVLHASKHLGDVPAINLLRVRSGDLVRFAGKCWRVKRVSREQISVLPVPRVHAGATDFMYPGGAVGWDPFLTDRLWQFLHSSAPLTGVLHRDLHDRVTGYVARVARDWPEGTVPYLREADGVRYWTFAGYLVNKAIGLVSRKPSFEAGDLCLKLPSPIDWGSIPTEPVDYESVFPLLFEVSSEQSVCQSLLPLDLQQVEFLQDWLRDETIPAVLTRLQRSRPLAVSGLP